MHLSIQLRRILYTVAIGHMLRTCWTVRALALARDEHAAVMWANWFDIATCIANAVFLLRSSSHIVEISTLTLFNVMPLWFALGEVCISFTAAAELGWTWPANFLQWTVWQNCILIAFILVVLAVILTGLVAMCAVLATIDIVKLGGDVLYRTYRACSTTTRELWFADGYELAPQEMTLP